MRAQNLVIGVDEKIRLFLIELSESDELTTLSVVERSCEINRQFFKEFSQTAQQALSLKKNLQQLDAIEIAMETTAGADSIAEAVTPILEKLNFDPEQRFRLLLAINRHYYNASQYDVAPNTKPTTENINLRNDLTPWQLQLHFLLFIPSAAYFEATLAEQSRRRLSLLLGLVTNTEILRQATTETSEVSKFLGTLDQLRADENSTIGLTQYCGVALNLGIAEMAKYPEDWQRKTKLILIIETIRHFNNTPINRAEWKHLVENVFKPLEIHLILEDPEKLKYLQALLAFDKAADDWSGYKAESIKEFCSEALYYCADRFLDTRNSDWKRSVNQHLLVTAQKRFQHDTTGKIWRLAVDMIFIPLGILTGGIAFKIKRDFTGACLFTTEKSKRLKRFHSHLEFFNKNNLTSNSESPSIEMVIRAPL